MLFCNTSTSAATCAVSIVSAFSVSGPANRLVNGLRLAPNQTSILSEAGDPLFAGDFISAVQQSGQPNAITLTISAAAVP